MKKIFSNIFVNLIIMLCCVGVGYVIGHSQGYRKGQNDLHNYMNELFLDVKIKYEKK